MNTERIEFLEDALRHIIRTAENSRTRTKRLAWIGKRCKDALDGVPYNRDEFDLPVMNTKSPVEYELMLRETKQELRRFKDMNFIKRFVFLFKGNNK